MADLELALADLAGHLEYPTVDDMAGPVVARLVAPDTLLIQASWRRRAVLAAAAVVALGVVALPAPREAVADWLGLRGVRVTVTDDTPEAVGTELRLGRQISLDEAAEVRTIEGLGPPAELYAGEPSPDSVSLVWLAGKSLPEVAGTGIGLLLTEIPWSIDHEVLDKQVGPGTVLAQVSVDGEPGYWISGARHVIAYRDADGGLRHDTTRLAANTLLWTDGDVTYRLESALDLDGALALAEQLVTID